MYAHPEIVDQGVSYLREVAPAEVNVVVWFFFPNTLKNVSNAGVYYHLTGANSVNQSIKMQCKTLIWINSPSGETTLEIQDTQANLGFPSPISNSSVLEQHSGTN